MKVQHPKVHGEDLEDNNLKDNNLGNILYYK